MEPRKPTDRDESIDVLRGVAMVVMALDHARDFFGDAAREPTDLAHTDFLLFFTRWITHFCAPIFVLLAGVSAFLSAKRRTPREASTQLVLRGLWLVVLELTVVRFGWLFDLSYRFTFLQVIWAIGWSMVVLALVSRAGPKAALVFGLAMIAGHDLLDGVHAERFSGLAWLWHIVHEKGRLEPWPGHRVFVAYPLVPWIGVIAVGFGMGPLLSRPIPARKALLLRAGLATTALFVGIRALDRYGDPRAWTAQPRPGYTVLSFLDCTKYPPSLDYLAMTLGPALIVWSLLAGRHSTLARPLTTFGRVPLFYYVLHLPLLHGMARLWLLAHGGWAAVEAAAHSDHGTGGSLALVYGGWALGVVLLFPLCRWFEGVKSRHHGAWWTSYV